MLIALGITIAVCVAISIFAIQVRVSTAHRCNRTFFCTFSFQIITSILTFICAYATDSFVDVSEALCFGVVRPRMLLCVRQCVRPSVRACALLAWYRTNRWTKTAICCAFGYYIFETISNKVIIIFSNIWSLDGFPLMPEYMTLTDLEWSFYVKFCFCAYLEVFDFKF